MLMKRFYTALIVCLTAASSINAGAAMPARKMHKAPQGIVATSPKVLPATDVSSTAFTANWENVAGAEGYCVFVYEPIDIESDGTYKVLDESFNLVNIGSTIDPVWDESFSCSLDKDYDFTFTPDWTVIGCAFAKGMVSGNVYTPTTDLTNNDGKYRLVLDIVGQAGTKIKVTSTGSTTEIKEAVLTEHGGGTLTFDFTNGNHETYLYIVDMGIEGDDDGKYADVISFFDNISIEQDLKAGDTVLRLVDINDSVHSPDTSCRFQDMKFLYDANRLCYDLYAAYVYYDDPTDPWNYDIDYSQFSQLQDVVLSMASIREVEKTDSEESVYYDLNGRQMRGGLSSLDSGIYIERRGNLTRKVLIR